MLVIGQQRRVDAVMLQQHAGHARVLGQNRIGARQDAQRAQTDVAEIDWTERYNQQYLYYNLQKLPNCGESG